MLSFFHNDITIFNDYKSALKFICRSSREQIEPFFFIRWIQQRIPGIHFNIAFPRINVSPSITNKSNGMISYLSKWTVNNNICNSAIAWPGHDLFPNPKGIRFLFRFFLLYLTKFSGEVLICSPFLTNH